MFFKIFLSILFIFICGGFIGWILEFCFRNIVHQQKKLINPGFLNGPFLPIYGLGFIVLYLICNLDISLILKLFLIMVSMTTIELIVGNVFLKFLNLRLWDYTNEKLNYKGIICLRFTIYWTILGSLFQLIAYPLLTRGIIHLFDNSLFVFILGMLFSGVIMDLVYTFDIVNRIKVEMIDVEENITLKVQELKLDVNQAGKTDNAHPSFFFNLKGVNPKVIAMNYIEKRKSKEE